jgi:hypothetical protein
MVGERLSADILAPNGAALQAGAKSLSVENDRRSGTNTLRTYSAFLGGCARSVSVRRLLWPVMVAIACAATVGPEVVCARSAREDARKPLTVADAIETARFHEDHKAEAVFRSPDGARYVSMVIRGDVKNDGIWVDILSGELSSLDAAKPRLVARRFTRGLPLAGPLVDSTAGPTALIGPGQNIPAWLDNDEIAFLWTDDQGHNQVFQLNVMSNRLKKLTDEPTDVVAFMIGPNRSLAYDVKVMYSPQRSQEMIRTGFSVKSPDADMLLSGVVDGTGLFDLGMCRRVVAVQTNGEYQAKPVADSEMKCDLSELYWGDKLISPDGRRLIINTHVSPVPVAWSSYRSHFGVFRKGAEENPHGAWASAMSEFVIVDMACGTSRPLWSAPAGLNPWSTVAWSPDSKYVLIAPTMLPVAESDAAGLEGKAVAIVDAETGRYHQIPVDPTIVSGIESTQWVSQKRIALALRGGQTMDFDYHDGQWRIADAGNRSIRRDKSGHRTRKIIVGVRQGLDQPPELIGTDVDTGRSRVLFDPNPKLVTRFALGHVELTRWTDSGGHPWEGRLYYPAHYRPGVRYPLVIQLHGYAGKSVFSIYGQGSPGGGVPLGPGWSVYLAQPLASRDIAVLQLGGPMDATAEHDTDFEKTKSRAKTLADATEHLVNVGLVDKAKVGIMGHSATGRVIEDALTFTDFPYAAAIAADCYELNYSQSMKLGWDVDEGMPAPFGKDLEVWLDASPAFNIQRIQTPLQLELTTGGGGNSTLLGSWEMYSRLRYLRKPVEYYVLPDITHGTHLVQNPRQLLALQNRALDWWLFWLASEEDPAPEKALQYQDWRTLRAMHMADLRQPKPPLRTWKSNP